MDQAPGPIIAKAAPRTACMMAIHGSPECESNRRKAIHTLTMAANDPASGVHRPTRRNNPAPAPMTCGTAIVNGGDSRRPTIAKRISANPVSSRRSRRPMPGQPSANVENSRCNPHLFSAYEIRNSIETRETGNGASPFWGIYSSMIPRFRAIVTACVRSLAPSFERIFVMWLLTVSSAMDS
jgi:hypothetical protein